MSTSSSLRSSPLAQAVVHAVDPGLHLWEAGLHEPSTGLATLTCAAPQAEQLISCVNVLLSRMHAAFPEMLRWCTHGRPTGANEIQKRRVYAALRVPPVGFTEIELCTGGPDTVEDTPSTVSRLALPFARSHLDAMSSYRRCLLVMAGRAEADASRVCAALWPIRTGVDGPGLASLLAAQRRWVLARFFEQDPFMPRAAQFYALTAQVEQLASALDAAGYHRLSGLTDLASALSGTTG